MFATVDLDADAILSVAVLQQRMFNATEEEMEAAIQAVAMALRHPKLRRAAAVGGANIRRETPAVLMLEDGTIAEGVVDLALRRPKEVRGMKVVNFICGHRVIAAGGRLADSVAIGALWLGGFPHRRLFDDPLRWFGRVAEADGDLHR
jgi:hypothetical protein